ncbi:MAG TPA: PTS sugar transporter subunit IIA [Pirellulales bacterium]|nr:PTS sugar transporter subunit IIA [Pirellulales bacterium]
MQLTLPDVVRLFEVSENQVHRWIQEEDLPVQIINTRHRFNRSELLEWATARGIKFSPAIFCEAYGETEEPSELLDALRRGGVKHLELGPEAAGPRSVLLKALDDMPLPEDFHREQLVQLLMARQSVGTTCVGDGIAIPHARYPLLLAVPRPAIRLCLLSQPIAFDAPDGKPVDTLFIMVCPTIHEHLRLLARLAGVLRDASFRSFLRTKPQQQALLDEIRRREESLPSVARLTP